MAARVTMTSRERVLAVLGHEQPDRLPVWCSASPEFWHKALRELNLTDEGLRVRLGDDFRRLHTRVEPPIPASLPPNTTRVTMFGVPRAGLGYGQALTAPLANATLREVYEYTWPRNPEIKLVGSPEIPSRKYAVIVGSYSIFWHDLIDLLGMENMYLKMHDEPRVVDAILRRIVDFYASVNRKIIEATRQFSDILLIASDFGSQHGPLLGDAMFRRFIVPHLRRLANLGHDYGLKVMLHSCGSIRPLIPAIIECGIDALHPIQPCRGMDFLELKQEFGHKIVFNGGIDAQHTLTRGTAEDVRRTTREVLRIMKPGGGYIGGASHDAIMGETPVENVLAMFDTLRAEGEYSQSPSVAGHAVPVATEPLRGPHFEPGPIAGRPRIACD